jgi:hypothetical protein
MMNPQGSGSSACESQTVSADLREKVEALIRISGWRGLFMVETLRDASGQIWFIEINGRPWGSLALSRRQGLEYPAWHVALALDPKSKAGAGFTSEPGVVCRNLGRELMHLLFVLRGPRSDALEGWPSFWQTLTNVVPVRSGESFYNWRSDDKKVFFADCYYTIKDNVFKSRQH